MNRRKMLQMCGATLVAPCASQQPRKPSTLPPGCAKAKAPLGKMWIQWEPDSSPQLVIVGTAAEVAGQVRRFNCGRRCAKTDLHTESLSRGTWRHTLKDGRKVFWTYY